MQLSNEIAIKYLSLICRAVHYWNFSLFSKQPKLSIYNFFILITIAIVCYFLLTNYCVLSKIIQHDKWIALFQGFFSRLLSFCIKTCLQKSKDQIALFLGKHYWIKIKLYHNTTSFVCKLCVKVPLLDFTLRLLLLPIHSWEYD